MAETKTGVRVELAAGGEAGETAEQRTDSLAGHDRPPRARSVHRVLRDVGAEHEERRVRDEEVERDPQHEHPDRMDGRRHVHAIRPRV